MDSSLGHIYSEKTANIEVLAQPFYVKEQSSPKKNLYFFAYNIAVHNKSNRDIKLIGRQWIVIDGKRKKRHVCGEGVIGETPIIKIGKRFQYTSFCPLETPTGNMRGKYKVVDNHDNEFWIKVPPFFFHTKNQAKIEIVY